MANEPYERLFILRWRSAVLNSSFGPMTKLCLLVLADYADVNGADCFPSIPSIARLMSANERTVRRNLEPAIDAGFIRRSAKSTGTTHGWKYYEYDLLIPEGADTKSARAAQGAGTKSAPIGETNGHNAKNVRTFCPKGVGTKSTELASIYIKASVDSAPGRMDAAKFEAIRKLDNAKYTARSDYEHGDLTKEQYDSKVAEIEQRLVAVSA